MEFTEYQSNMRDVPAVKAEFQHLVRSPFRPLPVPLVSVTGITVPEHGIVRFPACFDGSPIVSLIELSDDNQPITDLILPASLKRISVTALKGCTNLRTIWLPRTVNRIEAGTFRDCTALTDVFYEGTREEWDELHIITYRDSVTSTGRGARFHVTRTPIQGNEALFQTTLHFDCTW